MAVESRPLGQRPSLGIRDEQRDDFARSVPDLVAHKNRTILGGRRVVGGELSAPDRTVEDDARPARSTSKLPTETDVQD